MFNVEERSGGVSRQSVAVRHGRVMGSSLIDCNFKLTSHPSYPFSNSLIYFSPLFQSSDYRHS